MSGLDKNRVRNQTVCFRATAEERRQIEARITVSGIPKGQFYIRSSVSPETDATKSSNLNARNSASAAVPTSAIR